MSLGMEAAKVRYDGKPIFYRSDGTGRDSYVVRSNGGLLSQTMLRTVENAVAGSRKADYIPMRLGKSKVEGMKKYSMPTVSDKFVHYHSDGTGRDSYVGWNHGGRIVNFDSKNNTESFFRTSLRSYHKMSSSQSASSLMTSSNFGMTGNSYLSTKQQLDKQ